MICYPVIPWLCIGDSEVSLGKGVPGACLLPPSHGPRGTLPVAWPDDACSVGQHHRPREARSVSPGICNWPQVCNHIYFNNQLSSYSDQKFTYTCSFFCRRKGTFFVSQVVLTPKASTVMKGVASGLRETITERYSFQREAKNPQQKHCYACFQHYDRACKSCRVYTN